MYDQWKKNKFTLSVYKKYLNDKEIERILYVGDTADETTVTTNPAFYDL